MEFGKLRNGLVRILVLARAFGSTRLALVMGDLDFVIPMAGGAVAAEGDFGAVDLAAGGKVQGRLEGARVVDRDIADVAAGFAVEVGMVLEIRAIPGRSAVEIHLPDKAAVGEGFEAIIDCGEGNAGDLLLHPHEDLRGGGVVALGGEDFKDLAALLGEAEFRAERESAIARRRDVGGFRENFAGHGGA